MAGCGGGAESPVVVTGTVYDEGTPEVGATVVLFPGTVTNIAEHDGPVDETTSDLSGRFELRADAPEETDRARFTVFVTYEGGLTGFASFCEYVLLPELQLDDGRWVRADTGEPHAPLEIATADEQACRE